MGFWKEPGDSLAGHGDSPEYWYGVGQNDGKTGGRRRTWYAGTVIADLRPGLHDTYHRGYDDGVREQG